MSDVRDDLADRNYFSGLLAKHDGWIEEDSAELASRIEEKGRRSISPIRSLIHAYLETAEMSYSRGDSIDIVRERVVEGLSGLDRVLGFFTTYPDESGPSSFLNTLRYLQFSVLLNPGESIERSVLEVVKMSEPFGTISGFLCGYISGKEPPCFDGSEVAEFPKYSRLAQAIVAVSPEDREAALYDYLTNWYSDLEAEDGVGSHETMIRYAGYWCWEAAAVAVARGIGDSRLRDHEHYPTELADWARNARGC